MYNSIWHNKWSIKINQLKECEHVAIMKNPDIVKQMIFKSLPDTSVYTPIPDNLIQRHLYTFIPPVTYI